MRSWLSTGCSCSWAVTLSGFISGAVSSRTQLIAVSCTAIVLIILAIFIPKESTIPCLNSSMKVEPKCLSAPSCLFSAAFALPSCGRHLQPRGGGPRQIYRPGFRHIHDDGGRRRHHASVQNATAKQYRLYGFLPARVVAMLGYLLFYGPLPARRMSIIYIPVDEEISPQSV